MTIPTRSSPRQPVLVAAIRQLRRIRRAQPRLRFSSDTSGSCYPGQAALASNALFLIHAICRAPQRNGGSRVRLRAPLPPPPPPSRGMHRCRDSHFPPRSPHHSFAFSTTSTMSRGRQRRSIGDLSFFLQTIVGFPRRDGSRSLPPRRPASLARRDFARNYGFNPERSRRFRQRGAFVRATFQ